MTQPLFPKEFIQALENKYQTTVTAQQVEFLDKKTRIEIAGHPSLLYVGDEKIAYKVVKAENEGKYYILEFG